MSRVVFGSLAAFVVCLACGGGRSVQPNPAAPSWLVAARSAGTSVDDNPCDFANPTYEALRHLNTGMMDAPMAARLAVETDAELEPIRSGDVGRRWVYSQDADIDSNEGIVEMLTEHPGWTEEYSDIPRLLTFGASGEVTVKRMGAVDSVVGTWTVQDQAVRVVLESGNLVLVPERSPFYMVLANETERWSMNPVVCL